jgi:hypothetical protein
MTTAFNSKWAILVGPKDYQYVQPLRYSTDDIVEVGKLFRDYLHFDGDKVFEFGTDLKYQPLGNVFHHEVGGLLKRKVIQEDDLLIFYFSGHGFRDDKDYLLPADATPNNLKKTAFGFEDVVADLTKSKCKNIVMFIDACRELIEEEGIGGQKSTEGQKGLVCFGEDSRQIVSTAGFATIFSCEPYRLSYEIEELKHGSFTYCFLNAIRNGRCATLADLYTYLLKEVDTTTKKYKNQPQIPYPVQAGDKWSLPIFLTGVPLAESARVMEELITDMQNWYAKTNTFRTKYFEAVIEFLDSARGVQLSEDEKERLNLVARLTTDKVKPSAFIAIWDGIEKRRQLADGGSRTPPDLGTLE